VESFFVGSIEFFNFVLACPSGPSQRGHAKRWTRCSHVNFVSADGGDGDGQASAAAFAASKRQKGPPCRRGECCRDCRCSAWENGEDEVAILAHAHHLHAVRTGSRFGLVVDLVGSQDCGCNVVEDQKAYYIAVVHRSAAASSASRAEDS
jgi:hypothetical protein